MSKLTLLKYPHLMISYGLTEHCKTLQLLRSEVDKLMLGRHGLTLKEWSKITLGFDSDPEVAQLDHVRYIQVYSDRVKAKGCTCV